MASPLTTEPQDNLSSVSKIIMEDDDSQSTSQPCPDPSDREIRSQEGITQSEFGPEGITRADCVQEIVSQDDSQSISQPCPDPPDREIHNQESITQSEIGPEGITRADCVQEIVSQDDSTQEVVQQGLSEPSAGPQVDQAPCSPVSDKRQERLKRMHNLRLRKVPKKIRLCLHLTRPIPSIILFSLLVVCSKLVSVL